MVMADAFAYGGQQAGLPAIYPLRGSILNSSRRRREAPEVGFTVEHPFLYPKSGARFWFKAVKKELRHARKEPK
jgi:hypothetical protein